MCAIIISDYCYNIVPATVSTINISLHGSYVRIWKYPRWNILVVLWLPHLKPKATRDNARVHGNIRAGINVRLVRVLNQTRKRVCTSMYIEQTCICNFFFKFFTMTAVHNKIFHTSKTPRLNLYADTRSYLKPVKIISFDFRCL